MKRFLVIFSATHFKNDTFLPYSEYFPKDIVYQIKTLTVLKK